MPRNLTGDGSRLLVKDETTFDLFCLSQKGVPICRLENECNLFTVSGSSDIMKIDNNKMTLYRFKTADPDKLSSLIDITSETNNKEMLSYSLSACREEDINACCHFINNRERILANNPDNIIFLTLVELWLNAKITFKGFAKFIINYLNQNKKELFNLYGQHLNTYQQYTDIEREIVKRIHSGETMDMLTNESKMLHELFDKLSEEATYILLEMRKAFKIYIISIKVVQVASPASTVVEYTNFITSLMTMFQYLSFCLSDELDVADLISDTKEAAIQITDLLVEKQEYSAAFSIWEHLLAIDPMTEAIHRRLEAVIIK